MSSKPIRRVRIALNVYLLNDSVRAAILAGIAKVAPQSPLMQIPAVAASYKALTTKGATLASDVSAAAEAEKVYKAAIGERDHSRQEFDLELITMKTLVENNGTNDNDAKGMGFDPLEPATPNRTPPEVPQAVVARYPAKRGKPVTVAVQGKGYLGNFAAQAALDPLGQSPSWFALPGRGKERKLTGYASGTKLWVRFAAMRFGMQSDWSVAVLVTIP